MEAQGILSRLIELGEEEQKTTDEKSLLWKRLYEIADDTEGENEPYRFIDPETMMVVGRTVAKGERLDEAKLEGALTKEEWRGVTQVHRSIDMEKLEVAVGRGEISADTVNDAKTTTLTPRKFGPRKASKEDRTKLAEDAGI